MKTFLLDLRYGLRLFLASPGSSLVAVLTLALGIGVNTTVLSWIDNILLRPIPGAAGPGRLAALETLTPTGDFIKCSYPDYRDFRDSLQSAAGIAAVFTSNARIGEGDNGEEISGELVTGNYFDMLGVRPELGRFFSAEETADPPAEFPVAVIGHDLWKTRFNGDRRAIGGTLVVNRRPLTIIGVAPQGFHGSMTGVIQSWWIPLTAIYRINRASPKMLDNRNTRNLELYLRLRPGVTLPQANGEAAERARQLAAAYPKTNEKIGAVILPVNERHTSGAVPLLRRPLQLLLAVCVVVMAIVCANVGNLLLARSTARQREFAIRLAVGSSRGRLVRQLFTETLLLAGAGAVLGVVFTMWCSQALVWLLPPVNVRTALDATLDLRLLALSAAVCVAAALISGMAPALLSLRPDLNETLKEGGREGHAGSRSHRARAMLVIGEVALATVTLIGAGLFYRSFRAASAMHPGFDSKGVLVARFGLADTGGSTAEQSRFCVRLKRELEASPAVDAVAYADVAPLGFDEGPWQEVDVAGYEARNRDNMHLYRSLVSPGYFNLLRIGLIEGRDFTEADGDADEPVAIVNRAFARRFFAGGNPIGHKVRAWGRWMTVVGLAADAKYHNLAAAPEPYLYVPYRRFFSTGLNTAFFVRTKGDPKSAMALLRHTAAGIDSSAEPSEMMPLGDFTGQALYSLRVASTLMAALGALAVLLAAVGLYSVMAYAVSQRTHELGIRMAVGARGVDVLLMVARQALGFTMLGVTAGIAAAFVLTRLAGGMLVSVRPTDPLTFAAAPLFLGAVAALASLVPARRATRVDPLVALRHQ